MKHIDQKLEIDYPCRWLYKVIGMEKEAVRQAIAEIVRDTDHTLSPSKTSSTGKYSSFNLEVMVHTEEARNFFFAALREHPSIKMVL